MVLRVETAVKAVFQMSSWQLVCRIIYGACVISIKAGHALMRFPSPPLISDSLSCSDTRPESASHTVHKAWRSSLISMSSPSTFLILPVAEAISWRCKAWTITLAAHLVWCYSSELATEMHCFEARILPH